MFVNKITKVPKKLTIKDWDIQDRPREKLLQLGVKSLSNAELIAILIGSGNREETALELAKRILAQNGNDLSKLAQKSVQELRKFKGIGTAKAISIVAALELCKRSEVFSAQNPKITNSFEAFKVLKPIFSGLTHEEVWILLVNNANELVSKHKISQGGTEGANVDIKLIFKHCILENAQNFIIAHNHISQDLEPSKDDVLFTQTLVNAANVMQIRLLDHLIVSGEKYFSFADNGLLNIKPD